MGKNTLVGIILSIGIPIPCIIRFKYLISFFVFFFISGSADCKHQRMADVYNFNHIFTSTVFRAAWRLKAI